ncbi:MAG: YbaN family protein [Lachnospiraceae bacterium]|nr:YbaN family protein [Lachnospiraceae bacterium]MCI7594659.1 YbaN family protein [Lachnospiraceae bacterium]MDD7050479.1 YbaN family protein [Lachnospiraceae bacterium]MDY3223979.1 YbaN family protein [Lachnospiraceae bacterium]MDY4095644.1 YbaN family protein [Lachnospiraceae bacterium]
MKLKKLILIIVGCLSVGLGALGSVLPLLPTFPFLLLATICFTRSSERLQIWFMGTKLYKDNLESYVKGEGMTLKTKLRIMGMSTFFMAISFFALYKVPIGQAIVALIWIALAFYFTFGIKTMKIDGAID